MPLPKSAELVEQDGKHIARWRQRNGRLRTEEVIVDRAGKLRVRGRSKIYMARYRDGHGHVVEESTGCRDAVAARAVLHDLERKAERVRAGLMSHSEGEAAEHADRPLSYHMDAYEAHLRAKGCDRRRISMVRRRLERIADGCGFSRINRMSAERVERWFLEQAETGMAAATRNSYRESIIGFGNWCRRTHRLTQNPFADLPRADQNADRRHQRRALSEEELLRLLKVARLRPLAEYGRETIQRDDIAGGSSNRSTWKREPLGYKDIDTAVARAKTVLNDNPALIEELEHRGLERYLIYKTLALTGLRKGELASITVGQFERDATGYYLILFAKDEKNRRGSTIPVRADLASELREWIAIRLVQLQFKARQDGLAIPISVPSNETLLCVPTGLTRIFNRDLAAADIPKRDARNRVVDVHALRVTFGTHLCAAGVPLRTAQAAMRHSKPELTANIYTDPQLIDIAGAIDALPALSPPQDVAVASNGQPRPIRATS